MSAMLIIVSLFTILGGIGMATGSISTVERMAWIAGSIIATLPLISLAMLLERLARVERKLDDFREAATKRS